jgi:small-conductance mechanosensitive channel
VLLLAGLAEWGVWWLLRRPIRAIARRAPEAAPGLTAHAETPEAARIEAVARERERAADDPRAGETEPPPVSQVAETPAETREDAEVEHVLRRRRFARTIRAFRRLPFVLLCFLLDLMPLGVFLGVGYTGSLFAGSLVQALLQAAVLTYAACRLAIAITRMVVAPEFPTLRLVHIGDQGAAYAVLWVRRVFVVAACGFAASQIGLLFGLPAAAGDAFLKAVFLVVHLLLVVVVLQCRGSVAARIRSHSPSPGIGGRLRNRLASVWHLVAVFYIIGLWLVWAAEVRNGYLRIWHLFLVTVAVLVVARLASIVLLGGLDRALRIGPEARQRYPGLERRANRYLPLLRGTISMAMTVVAGLALLQVWGINTLSWFRTNALGGKLVSAALTIFIAAALALAVWEGVNASMDRHLARLTQQSQLVRSARLRTLLPILRTMLFATLAAIFGLTALSEVGVNIAPLLAGAGILGVAIGFGSQKLVQDFITGIFLLIENAMQVGDWVTVAGLSGSVENLSIRTMRLRAGDGSVHIIPFSSVSTVTNVNRGIGNAAVSVNVPIEEDTDRVSEVLSGIAREMRAERRFADMMRSDLQLWGVDKVDAGVATIVGQIVCTDDGRWAVQREFNRRMAISFKEEGLRIATPVTTVYNHIASEAPRRAAQDEAAVPSGQLDQSPPPAALGNTA